MFALTSPRARLSMSRSAAATVAALALFAIVSLACAPGPTGESGATTDQQPVGSTPYLNATESRDVAVPGGKIVYGLSAESNGWNPGFNQWAASGKIVSRTFFDTLTAFDDKGDVHPFVAERLEHNADFTEWTVTLRQGIAFHNGKPVTADAVVRVQQYLMRSPVVGGAYYFTQGIQVKDDRTFSITMKKPFASFPASMATSIGVVADPDWIESNNATHPIGTGPFVFDSWTPGDKLTVRKNPAYWRTDDRGTRLPYLDTVEFRIITDDLSRSTAIRSGEVDLIQTASGRDIVDFRDRASKGEFQSFSDAKFETLEDFVMLNTLAPPFDDVDARRALAHAIDQDDYVDVVTGGVNERADSAYGQASRWHTDVDGPEYDLETARALVEKVKAKNGGRFAFTLTGATRSEFTTSLQYLQQRWIDVGIEVEIVTYEQAAGIIHVVAGDYQAVLWQQFDFAHPIADSIFWLPDEARPIPEFSLNFARLKDDEINDALNAAAAAPEFDAQYEAFARVQRRQAELVPYVWLAHSARTIVARPGLVNLIEYRLPDGTRGLEFVQGSHPLDQVWLTR